MPELSAADKNELRRQKILAKRKTRMAYAAGDRTALPSTAAADPASPPPPASIAASAPDSAPASASAPASRAMSSTSSAATAAPLPPLPRLPSFAQLAAAAPPRRANSVSARAARLAGSARLRLALCLLLGVLFAIAAAPEPVLSAVEAFCVLQAVLAVPAVPRMLRRRLRPSGPSFLEPGGGGGGGGGGGLLGVVDFVTRASQVFVIVNRVFGELCVYLTAFLLTADLVGRWA